MDRRGGEIPSHMHADVRDVLSWSAVRFVREEVAEHFADEEAELGLFNHLEDGDVSFVYGQLEQKLRDRISAEFEHLKELGDDGVDQET